MKPDNILKQIEEAVETINNIPDPVRDMMIDKGFDPKNGCKLLLPIALKSEFGDNTPPYVEFHALINSPIIYNPNWKKEKPTKVNAWFNFSVKSPNCGVIFDIVA